MTEPVRRVHYFLGGVLSVDDLQAEQDYHRRMRYLHNRLHGSGVVEGFGVTVEESHISVSPGLALDPLGRELVGVDECVLDWAAVGDRDVEVHATWAEEPDAFSVGTDPNSPPFSRWLERPRLSLEPPESDATESVVLAHISRAEDGTALVDTSVRRQLGCPPTAT